MTLRRRGRSTVVIVAVVIVAASVVVGIVASGGLGARSPAAGAGDAAGGRSEPATAVAPVATTPGAGSPAVTTPAAGSSGAGSSDIAAARACQAFAVYLADARRGAIPRADGAKLVASAGTLLQGSRAARAAGDSLPKWAALGSELLSAADDVVGHNYKALATDGAAADRSCARVPAAAARAGGYRRTG